MPVFCLENNCGDIVLLDGTAEEVPSGEAVFGLYLLLNRAPAL
jgi:hypothetical protein